MLKFATTLFTTFSLLFVTLTIPAAGQTKQPPTADNEVSQSITGTKANPDLKVVFDEKTNEFKMQSAAFDPIKTDRENAQAQAQKKGWSTTKKTLVITAIAVGIAGLLFLVIKYGKECLRTNPENCSLNIDENCTCEEYERRIPKGQ